MTDDRREELAQLCAKIQPPTPYPFDDEDGVLIAEANDLDITDAETYTSGFTALKQLTGLEKAIELHYEGQKKPLNLLREIIIAEAKADAAPILKAKASLSRRLTTFKDLADARDREERQRQQAEADAAAAAVRDAQAANLRKVATVERDPVVKASLTAQAEAVAAVPAVAQEVTITPTAPKTTAGGIRKRYVPAIVDVRALLAAWLKGDVQLDIEQDLIEAILPRLRDAAKALGPNISKVYPGVSALEDKKAVSR